MDRPSAVFRSTNLAIRIPRYARDFRKKPSAVSCRKHQRESDRGNGRPFSPPTPPYMRVRIRPFGELSACRATARAGC
jgi:hypothetical protein